MTRYLFMPRTMRKMTERGAKLRWKKTKGRDVEAGERCLIAASSAGMTGGPSNPNKDLFDKTRCSKLLTKQGISLLDILILPL